MEGVPEAQASVQVEGLVTVRRPEAGWECEELKTSVRDALGKGIQEARP